MMTTTSGPDQSSIRDYAKNTRLNFFFKNLEIEPPVPLLISGSVPTSSIDRTKIDFFTHDDSDYSEYKNLYEKREIDGKLIMLGQGSNESPLLYSFF